LGKRQFGAISAIFGGGPTVLKIVQAPKTYQLQRKSLHLKYMVARFAMPYTVLALLKHRGDVPLQLHSGKCRQQSKSRSMVQEGTHYHWMRFPVLRASEVGVHSSGPSRVLKSLKKGMFHGEGNSQVVQWS
jgi:hypothetical protein